MAFEEAVGVEAVVSEAEVVALEAGMAVAGVGLVVETADVEVGSRAVAAVDSVAAAWVAAVVGHRAEEVFMVEAAVDIAVAVEWVAGEEAILLKVVCIWEVGVGAEVLMVDHRHQINTDRLIVDSGQYFSC